MNKLTFYCTSVVFLLILFTLEMPVARSQNTELNKYELWVITSKAQLNKTVKHNQLKAMTDINKIIPGLRFDLRYTGNNNFMRQKLYPNLRTSYLRIAAPVKLSLVQQELELKGFGLKIFDAYRPYSVTVKMWETVKDERYAANPKYGSGHNRGVAVDLTIIDLQTNLELNMGTGFDNFSDTAYHNFTKLPLQIVNNRILLRSTIEKYGFKALETEWWQYYLPNAAEFELLDIPFKKLKSLQKKYHD